MIPIFPLATHVDILLLYAEQIFRESEITEDKQKMVHEMLQWRGPKAFLIASGHSNQSFP